MANKLTGPLQQSVLTLLVMDERDGAIAAGILNPDLFEPPYDIIAAKAIAFRQQFKKAPGKAHLDDLFDDILGDPKSKKRTLYEQVLGGILEQAEGFNGPYVLGRVNEFIHRQTLQIAILEAAERFQRGGDDVLADAQNILHKGLKFKSTPLDAGTFLNDQKRFLRFMEDDWGRHFALGIPELDRLKIGPTVGRALAFMAPKGRGKCLVGETLIQLPDGRLCPIEQLVRDREPEVLAFDDKSLCFVKAKVSRHIENGIKPIYLLRTKLGHEIRCTANHPFFTEIGWTVAGELQPGKSRVALPWRLAGLGAGTAPGKELRLLGYLIANGSLSRRDIGWMSKDSAIRADFEKCLSHFGDRASWSNGDECLIVGGKVRDWLDGLGLLCKKSSQKGLPDFLFKLNDGAIREFLDALFTCDLGIWKSSPIIEYTSASAALVRGVRFLLQRLGIAGKYVEFDAKFRGKVLPGYAKLSVSTSHNLVRFKQTFTLLGKKAQRLTAFKFRSRQPQWQYQRPLNEDAFFDIVESIEPVGEAQTYDISVPYYHSFVANGIVAHNTWFCIEAAVQAMMQRAKVVHITLEMSEEEISQRYAQRLFALAKRKEKTGITEFERDELKRVIGFDYREFTPKHSLADPDIQRRMIQKMNDLGTRLSRLVVKKFTSKSLTLGGLEAYLDALELTHRFVPDLLIVDYPKLMDLQTSAEFQRIGLGTLFEKLKGVCESRNLAGVYPIQANRKGESTRIITGEHTGEDYSQGQTADMLITYNQTKQEHEMGLARLYVDKARSDRDKFTVLIAQHYATGQFVTDSAFMPNNYWKQIKAEEGEGDDQ